MQDEPLESPESDPGATPPVAPPPANLPTPSQSTPAPAADEPASPAWANDLRKLYNAVLEEPLPDNVLDLLSQLDAED